MTPSEDPPSKVSCVLMFYDRLKNDMHPVTVNYFAKDVGRFIEFTVKVPTTTEELKQELRTSIKSGRKYDYESELLAVAFADGDESLGV